jgi:hypothetical protein
LGSIIEYYKGPEVTIVVDKKRYKLPKRLLCHNSTFFSTAFNSNFKEGKEQKMTLETSVGAFEMTIKWMYTGHLGLPARALDSSEYLSQLLEFLTLSDFLGLLGPFTSVTDKIRSILSVPANLRSEHIHKVMKLPAGTLARTIIVQACVGPYLESLGWSYTLNQPTLMSKFRFEKEWLELNGFAVELFQIFDKTIRKTEPHTYGYRRVLDPVRGQYLYYK